MVKSKYLNIYRAVSKSNRKRTSDLFSVSSIQILKENKRSLMLLERLEVLEEDSPILLL